MRTPGILCLSRLIFYVAVNAWTGVSSVVPGLLNSCGGSRVFGVSSSLVTLLM